MPASEGSPEQMVAEKELSDLQQELAWELSKEAVDAAGIVNPTPISDRISVAMRLKEGTLIGAGLSLIPMAPSVGDAIGKTAKGEWTARKVAQLRKRIATVTAKLGKLERRLQKVAKRVRDAISKAKKALNSKLLAVKKSLSHQAAPARVDKPGEHTTKHRSFQTHDAVPKHYRDNPRFLSLASDPADARNPIRAKSRREAMAGLEAERQGLVKPPIERGPKEIEFYDGDGVPYDVKTPPSPAPGESWTFKARRSGDSILEQIRKTAKNKVTGDGEPVRVILDSSYMNEADHKALWDYLLANATADELSRIIELNTRL